MSESLNQHDLYGDANAPHDGRGVEMLGARVAALELLNLVLGEKHTLDQALEEHEGFRALPSRDRAFCRMIVSTTLRRLGQIDDLITKAEERPGSKNIVLHNILRMGVAQIIFMEVPDHAAVDTSVRLTDAAEMDRQKGFVNGLLRTMTRVGREWVDRQDEGRLNTPEWLLKQWIEDYGMGTAAQIAGANLCEAALDITIKDEDSRNYWASNLKASQIGAGTLRVPSGSGAVHDLPGFDDGMWWVQDVSAAIPARLFGDVAGRTVLDLCAAPGGKTLQLTAMGARVTALDRSANRLKRLSANLQRMRLEDHVAVTVADAAVWKPAEAPSLILLDAPCTATGTIRRNPDVAILKTQRDFERLVNVQTAILQNAFDMLAPGGVLVYCTCSLQKAEGEDQIYSLFKRNENARKLPIMPEEIGGLKEPITPEGDLRIFPYHLATFGGMDGFFISRLTKVG